MLQDTIESGPNAPEQLKQYLNEIKASGEKWQPVLKRIERSRNYVKGYIRGESRGKQVYDNEASHDNYVKVNMVFSTLQSLIPYIYASNPAIACRPSPHITPRHPEYTMMRNFSRTCEYAINDAFKEAGLKKRMKTALRSAQAAKVGWLKMSYQREFFEDPLIRNRINDIQDQLANIGQAMQNLRENGVEITEEAAEVKENELNQMLESLNQQVEVLKAEGLVIDNIRVDDMRMDPTIDTLENYTQARWLAHRTFYSVGEAAALFNLTVNEQKNLKRYAKNADGSPMREGEDNSGTAGRLLLPEGIDASSVRGKNDICAVWEMWNKDTNSVYTMIEGLERWAREPWAPSKGGARFYPFFMLGFNWVDGEEWPLSDAELLMELQDEYQLTREQQARHRALSKPFWVGDKGSISSMQDIENFEQSSLGEIVLVDAAGNRASEVFAPAAVPPMNPVVYDTTAIRVDMDTVSGLPEAHRGQVIRQKTATEATMQDQGLSGRTGEKQDTTEELLAEMADFGLQILLQEVPPETMIQRYGESAVWPQFENKWDLYNMVNMEVRAGSTGKPNKMMERQQWSMLLPEIKATIDRALMMQAQLGLPIEDNPYVNILKETLRRMDERLDPLEFLGSQFGQMQQLAMNAISTPGGPAVANMMNSVVGAGGAGSSRPAGGSAPGQAGQRTESDAVDHSEQGTGGAGPQPIALPQGASIN